MRSDTNVLILLDTIIEAAGRLDVLVLETSDETIENDWKTYDAICLGLIRIGEAAKALPDDVKLSEADVPWAEIVALRNRIAHGYDTLQKWRILEIARMNVPPLAETARRIRSRLEGHS